jgi:hypothetical protein
MTMFKNLATAKILDLHDADPWKIQGTCFHFPEPDRLFLCVSRLPNDHISGYTVWVFKMDGRCHYGRQLLHSFTMRACARTRFAISKILMVEHTDELQKFNIGYLLPQPTQDLLRENRGLFSTVNSFPW